MNKETSYKSHQPAYGFNMGNLSNASKNMLMTPHYNKLQFSQSKQNGYKGKKKIFKGHRS